MPKRCNEALSNDHAYVTFLDMQYGMREREREREREKERESTVAFIVRACLKCLNCIPLLLHYSSKVSTFSVELGKSVFQEINVFFDDIDSMF